MARYDKYDPISGGFRAPAAAAWASGTVGVPTGVGLDANGRVVAGAGASGIVGIVVVDQTKAAGDVLDVMTHGEIVEMTGLTAGTVYYINDATGALETAAPAAGANKSRAGWTVETTRLVARVARVQG